MKPAMTKSAEAIKTASPPSPRVLMKPIRPNVIQKIGSTLTGILNSVNSNM